MKLILFENADSKSNGKIIEMFGLSRSGKSTYINELKSNGKLCLGIEDMQKYKKLIYSLYFFISSPMKAFVLFKTLNSNKINLNSINLYKKFRIFILRNSYLLSALAKYQMLKNIKRPIYVDEYLMQSIFMIQPDKSDKSKLEFIISLLPKSGKILVVESIKKERYARIKRTRFPAQQIDKNYAIQWMKNMEFNYPIIMNILKRNYKRVKYRGF